MAENTTVLTVGQRMTVDITDLAFGGDGVARAGDFVVFVPFVLVGETVEVEVTEIKKRFARARLVNVLNPSPERVLPACQHYGQCGGCQYQHLDYKGQLRLKRKQVADIMERIGDFSGAVVMPTVPCPAPYGYRNRIMVRSQWDKFKQGLNIGFIRADSRLVLNLDECEIASPELNRQLRLVHSSPPPKGGLKVLLRQLPDGWEVPQHSFFQNNFWMLPGLISAVQGCLRGCGARYLVDVYCGVGYFSIELAGQVEQFAGLECDRMAVNAARRNAAARSCHNGEFIEGLAEELLPSVLERFPARQTAVLIDPPRTGCPMIVLEPLRQSGVQQVIYVSCNPATLARDLKKLCAEGIFKLEKVIPLDMFPQTQHVECVAELRLDLHSAGVARGLEDAEQAKAESAAQSAAKKMTLQKEGI